MTVFFLVIMPLPDVEVVAQMTGPSTQLIPFRFISDIISEASTGNKPIYLNAAVLQVVFNIIMTIPFGMYLRYYFKFSFKKTLLFSFLLSLFFELTQLSGLFFIYPRAYRLFDVDDLMVNTLGGVLGYLIFKPFMRILPSRDSIDTNDYKQSEKVSMLRRIMAHYLDLLIITAISLVLYIFTDLVDFSFKYMLTSTYLYLIITPLIFKGSTPGQAYVKIKTTDMNGNYSIIRTAFKYTLLFILYYYLPLFFMNKTSDIFKVIMPDFKYRFVVIMTCASVTLIYYLSEALGMFLNHRILHEKLSGTKLISTVKND